MQVFVTVPKVTVSKKAWQHHKKAAIYVISMTSDGRPNQPVDTGQFKNLGIPIANEQLLAVARHVQVKVSPPYENIEPDQPLPLIGDGLLIYPPTDPQGSLSVYLAVVQSRSGRRGLGKAIEGIFSDPSVKDGASKLEGIVPKIGKVSSNLVFGLIGDVGSAFGRIFSHSQDQILVSTSFSGLEEDNYEGSPQGKSYPVNNELASLELRITATPASVSPS